MKYLFFFLILFYTGSLALAQDDIQHCGNDAYMHQLSVKDPALYNNILKFQQQLHTHTQSMRTATLPDTIIRIPVVVHVIHNNAGGVVGGANNPNISDAQVRSQIAVLNKDYQHKNADSVNTRAIFKAVAANCKFEFCLAEVGPDGKSTTGITRTYTSKANFTIAEETTLKGLSYWPSDQYLNIWVCDLRGTPSTQLLLGYSSQPGGLTGGDADDPEANTDGVVINYKAFGTVGTLFTKYNLGRTTSHEIGHWFGLLHTWGNFDSGFCNQTDYCSDTPVCANAFAAASPGCADTPPKTCNPVTARMIENYMDYSDDGCMNLFTQDQKTRMRSSIELSPRRNALLYSLGCCTITNLVAVGYKKSFEDGSLLSDGWSTINPNAASIYTKGFELNNAVSGYGNGGYSASVANDSVYIASDNTTHKYTYSYVSPYINLQNANIPKIRFDWAYSPKVTNGSTDSIVVYIASGCVGDWNVLHTLYGNSFTSTSNARALFTPNADEWGTTEIDVNAYKNIAAIRVKFVAYSKGINTFYLDNIHIVSASEQLLVNIYPIPTSGLVNVSTTFEGKKHVHYAVYNTLGQFVYEATEEDVYSNIKELNLSFLASGVYFIKVSNGKDTVLKRIVKH